MIEIKTNKKYQVIYLDPPWKYGGSGGTKWSPASHYYDVMPLEDIIAMKPEIDKISDEDSCMMFMWCCGPTIKDAITLGEAWGFEYITMAFVWYKERANVGNYTMSQCEYVLLFKKGKIPADRERHIGTHQFLSCPIGEHSQKPYIIRDRITQLFPDSNKIELFSRCTADGWDCWGNALNDDNSVIEGIKLNNKLKIINKRLF